MRDHVFIDTAAAVVRDGDAETWAGLEERWRAYGNRYEQALAARALGRLTGDEAAEARGVEMLRELEVPT
jgi:hypothetical protein